MIGLCWFLKLNSVLGNEAGDLTVGLSVSERDLTVGLDPSI